MKVQLLFSALTAQSGGVAEEGRSLAAVMIRRVITAEFSEFFPKLTAEQQERKKKCLFVRLIQSRATPRFATEHLRES